MTNHAGYAVEYADGTQESVYNLATAKYLVSHGEAVRIYDTYFGYYIITEVPGNKLITTGVSA
jgi:hypothetical protein